MKPMKPILSRIAAGLALASVLAPGAASADPAAGLAAARAAPQGVGQLLPTGQSITPRAAPNAVYQPLLPNLPDAPNVKAGFADSEALSPDGRTLLVLTTGYNLVVDADGKKLPKDSTQFIFVFDVSGGTPVQRQVVPVSNSFVGIAFAPDGRSFYVPGAGEDDVHVFTLRGDSWAETGAPIPLGHKAGNGIGQRPLASGIAVTADGTRAVVVDRYNDSVSILDLARRSVLAEQDLRPGKSGGATGVAGGEYPNSVAVLGNRTAYVSSERDREVVVVDISGARPSVTARIPVEGNPNKMVLDAAGRTLYVASDNADIVSAISTATNAVTATVSTIAPTGLLAPQRARYKGASPNGLALSPDGGTLYATNRGTNSLAVISLTGDAPRLAGLIPTGWYPSDVRASADGRTVYVANAKTDPGPNPGNCLGYETVPCPVPNSPVAFRANDYILNLTGSALLSFSVPRGTGLEYMTQRVAANNGFDAPPVLDPVMAALRQKIKHVIYIVKENRTYDQVLGDLRKANGDPNLAEFPRGTTPNQHEMAARFVTFDNFYDAGDVSGNGWPWSTAAKESDAGAKMLPPNYAGAGGSYDWEGANRNVNVGLAGAARVAANPIAGTLDPDTLPGTNNVAAPDGPNGEVQKGYLWNAALRAGKTVRNYGFYIDLSRYFLAGTANANLQIPLDRSPYPNTPQSTATNPQLVPHTDAFFRGYDGNYPDFYREREWEREFAGYVARGDLPNLSLVRFMNDHTGSFKTAIDGVNRPDVQVADNDYAVGALVQAVARSYYALDTLIFVVEDDAQDGPDHVDAHRSTAFIVGPYVKHGAVVSTHYTTVSMLRTISDVLGMDHLSIYDANQKPMSDAFDLSLPAWGFDARPSSLLRGTALPFAKGTRFADAAVSPRDPAYWIARTRGLDFTQEDKVDAVAYNRILWAGLMGGRPYPANGGRPLSGDHSVAQVATPPKHHDDDDDD